MSENLKVACQRMCYDQCARDRELNPDEEVLVLLPTSSNKLLVKWQGPYRVLCRLRKVNVYAR